MDAARSIGLRELKEHTGRVVRDVSASGEPIDITNHGKTIARIVPAEAKSREQPVYISGTRLKVWHVIQTHRLLGSDEQATAEYFEIAREAVHEATRYAAAYPADIDRDIERNEAAFREGAAAQTTAQERD